CNPVMVAQPVRSTIAAIVNRAMFVTERLSNILVLRCAMCCADKTSGLLPWTQRLLFGDPTVNFQLFINYRELRGRARCDESRTWTSSTPRAVMDSDDLVMSRRLSRI